MNEMDRKLIVKFRGKFWWVMWLLSRLPPDMTVAQLRKEMEEK